MKFKEYQESKTTSARGLSKEEKSVYAESHILKVKHTKPLSVALQKLAKKYKKFETDDKVSPNGHYLGSHKVFQHSSGKIEYAENISVAGSYGLTSSYRFAVKIGNGVTDSNNITKQIFEAMKKEMVKVLGGDGFLVADDNSIHFSYLAAFSSGKYGSVSVTMREATNFNTIGIAVREDSQSWK